MKQNKFTVVPAVYIIFRNGDKVLLSQRANTGYYDGSYSLPGGHVDGDEPAIMAAIREAKEELGAEVDVNELRLVHTMHRFSDKPHRHERVDLGFETTKPHLEITNCEPDKCGDLEWFPLDDLPENIVPEVKVVLDEVAKGITYSHFGFGI